MKVYAYYERLPHDGFEDDPLLIEKWRACWTRHGWDTHVLDESGAHAHPMWPVFASAAREWPTINPKGYEFACWVRWLSLSTAMRPGETGLFVDYDVWNGGFTPADAAMHGRPEGPVGLFGGCGSSPVVLNKWQADAMGPLLYMGARLLLEEQPGIHHIADMMALERVAKLGWMSQVRVCTTYGEEPRGNLVHVARDAAVRHGIAKDKAFDQLEDYYGH
jgi:hypothetical protein